MQSLPGGIHTSKRREVLDAQLKDKPRYTTKQKLESQYDLPEVSLVPADSRRFEFITAAWEENAISRPPVVSKGSVRIKWLYTKRIR
jgi:hypothetical protein